MIKNLIYKFGIEMKYAKNEKELDFDMAVTDFEEEFRL